MLIEQSKEKANIGAINKLAAALFSGIAFNLVSVRVWLLGIYIQLQEGAGDILVSSLLPPTPPGGENRVVRQCVWMML